MRSAKEQECFPYDLKTTCYIMVKNNGDVSQVTHNKSKLKAAYDLDDWVSRYARIDCKFKCGCSFQKIGIKKFANDMREQKGWVVATSTGYGCHCDEFTILVTRASLKRK